MKPVYAYIVGKTAPVLEGPWSNSFTIYVVGGGYLYVYSPKQQMQYDTSGKALVVGYTAYPNILQTIKVVGTFHSKRTAYTELY